MNMAGKLGDGLRRPAIDPLQVSIDAGMTSVA
jgi:hypothetical protein